MAADSCFLSAGTLYSSLNASWLHGRAHLRVVTAHILQQLKKRYRHFMAAIHQRRKVVAALLLCNGGQGPQGRKAHRQMNFSWAEHVGQLTEEEFRLRYRFTFEGFYELLDKICDDLLVHDEELAATAKWGCVVEPETKLAMALRYLAGGSPLDLRLIYAVSKSYVYDCIWLVVDAVNKAFPHGHLELQGTDHISLHISVSNHT